jgi:hypothetical protein
MVVFMSMIRDIIIAIVGVWVLMRIVAGQSTTAPTAPTSPTQPTDGLQGDEEPTTPAGTIGNEEELRSVIDEITGGRRTPTRRSGGHVR